MLNELLPLPEFNNSSIDNGDLLNFKFYRNKSDSNVIILPLNNDYKDLPNYVAPVGASTAEYITLKKNDIIQYSNTVSPLFKLTSSGLYQYNVELECFGDVNGTIGVLFTNESNTIYKNDAILIKDITTASTSVKFSALLSHDANDFVKLRFTGLKTGGGVINLKISYINLYIEKK
jgi:hypothetical protein